MVALFLLASRFFVPMAREKEEIDKEEFLIALGQHIKEIRESKGLSAAEFGRRADMERSHVARLEAGGTNPTSTTLLSICNALEIKMEDLFNGFQF